MTTTITTSSATTITTTTTTGTTTTTKSCTIKNATELVVNEGIFCGKYFGQHDRVTGAEMCAKVQASLPLPQNRRTKLLNVLRDLVPEIERNKNTYIDLKETDRQGKVFSEPTP